MKRIASAFLVLLCTSWGARALGAAAVDVAAVDHARILKMAEAALAADEISIARFRAPLSEGGPNDFYSNGDYWWPNPGTPTGLPYVRRDGESNPNNFNKHRECLLKLRDTVAALAAGYRVTGEERYVKKAVQLLVVFFLDPKSRMNPSLTYAQAIPGVSPGRGTGIIDTLHLVEVVKGIETMAPARDFPPEALAGLKTWFRDYVQWMTTSKNGLEEAAATNNHAVAFWLQVAVFAQFAGDEKNVAESRRRFKEVFVSGQMAPDGSFPRELARTKPYGYSIFQLDNMASLCQVLSTPSDNLWQFALPDGRGIRKAMEFLYPYLKDKSKWPHKPDVQAWDAWPARQPCLLFGGLALDNTNYLALWRSLRADPIDPEVRRNICITQPVLWMASSDSGAAMPAASAETVVPPEIRTPPAPRTPRINGLSVFGVRPGHPFLYHIPTTGERPMKFAVDALPAGLKVDAASGNITGAIAGSGEYRVTFHAANALGKAEKQFKIVVGETIALTPPMGWNSWNHYAGRITGELVLQNAKAMADSGLIEHGWTYLNIDDTWQGSRGGPLNAIQGNEKFPDMADLCTSVHALGLKIGIYSTPWTTSYATHIGGSAENPEGTWTKPAGKKVVNKKVLPWAIGKYHFTTNDAAQWAAWGMDYLKYDWNPIELPETQEMYEALRHSGRDLVFSLSNNMNITNAPGISPIANSWRTSGDIKANWQSMSSKGFGEDKWARFASPGHWNDPDMLEIGTRERNQPGLKPDEEYTHITLWCLDAAPLLLGNDLTQMDAFTLNLLENDEVLAVNQDPLGRQALTVSQGDGWRVCARPLADGSLAVGLFNTGTNGAEKVTVHWDDLKVTGRQIVRDLWRQKDLGAFEGEFSVSVAPHGAEMVKVTAAR